VDIMNSIDTSNNESLLFCLQLCPLKKYVYAAVGKKSASLVPSSSTTGKNDIKGKIPVDVDDNKFFIVEKVSSSNFRSTFFLFSYFFSSY
jgi:hypothetical protein